MNQETETYVKISFKEGILEVSGSEEFISNNIDKLTELLRKNDEEEFQGIEEKEADNSQESEPKETPSTKPNNINPFESILHFEENTVKILKKISGSNKAQKSINTALVYLWGMKRLGKDNVPSSEIRELCKSQGCLDSKNFSSHMKSAIQDIIVSGKQGSSAKTCKLTIPGLEKAEKLLESLQ